MLIIQPLASLFRLNRLHILKLVNKFAHQLYDFKRVLETSQVKEVEAMRVPHLSEVLTLATCLGSK